MLNRRLSFVVFLAFLCLTLSLFPTGTRFRSAQEERLFRERDDEVGIESESENPYEEEKNDKLDELHSDNSLYERSRDENRDRGLQERINNNRTSQGNN